jgi:hypothetical protein
VYAKKGRFLAASTDEHEEMGGCLVTIPRETSNLDPTNIVGVQVVEFTRYRHEVFVGFFPRSAAFHKTAGAKLFT